MTLTKILWIIIFILQELVQGSVYLNSGDEGLKDAGYDLIQSDILKNQVVVLFETIYPEMLKTLEDIKIATTEFRDYLNRNIVLEGRASLVPENYDIIINDTYYYAVFN